MSNEKLKSAKDYLAQLPPRRLKAKIKVSKNFFVRLDLQVEELEKRIKEIRAYQMLIVEEIKKDEELLRKATSSSSE